MQLQVVLDRQGFSPGVIDGKEGMSLTAALRGFQRAHDLTDSGHLDEPTRAALVAMGSHPFDPDNHHRCRLRRRSV